MKRHNILHMMMHAFRFFFLVTAVTLPVIYGVAHADPIPAGVSGFVLVGEHLNSSGKPKTRIVNTKYGDLRGFITNLPNKQLPPVEVFLGVPYASPPTHALRFMPPVTPAHWKGVLNADRFSPVCPQKPPDIKNETEALKHMPAGRLDYLKKLLPHLQNQSEDCLYLNIYAPQKAGRDTGRVPVLVYIHGESYEWNAGNPYDGSVLASFGKVVVVTVNYRLGVLGWLPVMEGSARGNYGLTDQVAALHWIQENIAEFGGDPKNVTLFGQGHGAALVNFLVLSPMSKGSNLFPAGLFHRAIMMSGSAVSPWAVARDANVYAQQIARTLGCPSEQPANLLECLRERSVTDILRVQLTVPMFLTSFGPTIDGIVIQNEPSKLMEEMANDHHVSSFDLLFGVTRVESYYYTSDKEDKNGMDIEKRDRLLRTLVRNIFNYHLQEIFLTIVNEYTDWTKTTQHDINVLEGTVDALGDALVVAPVVKTANYHSQNPRKAYFYVFTYQTEDSKYPQRQGCVSGEDLQFVFGAPLVGNLGPFSKNYTQDEVALSQAVMTYWVNFAKNGDPNTPQPERSQEKAKGRNNRVVWPSYDNVHQRYMMLGIKPKVRDHYHAHRLSFWLNLFPQLHGTSSATVAPEHHLLDDHDNLQSYEGVVRQVPFQLSKLAADAATDTPETLATTIFNDLLRRGNKLLTTMLPEHFTANATIATTTTANATQATKTDTIGNALSTTLSVAIAVGASLLLLNILIFAGIYYQRDKASAEEKQHQQMMESAENRLTGVVSTDNQAVSMEPTASVSHVKSVSLRAPPPSPVCQTEIALIPPPQKLHHPHRIPLKPCAVPTPPQLNQKESLVDVHTFLTHGMATMPRLSPVRQFAQNAQVHHNHHEIKL